MEWAHVVLKATNRGQQRARFWQEQEFRVLADLLTWKDPFLIYFSHLMAVNRLYTFLSVVFFSDVFCGYLLCTNIGRNPRIGTIKGEITPASFNHQGRLVECRLTRPVYVLATIISIPALITFGLILPSSSSHLSSSLYAPPPFLSSQRWSRPSRWWDWFRLRGGWDSLWAVNDVPWPQVSAHPVTQHEHLPYWT